MGEDKIEEVVEKPSRKVEAVLELQENVEIVGNMIPEAVPGSCKDTSKETGNVSGDMSKEVNNLAEEIIGLIENKVDDRTEDIDDSMNESDVNEESHCMVETENADEIEDDPVLTEKKEEMEDAGSYVESSICLGDYLVKEKEEDRKRLMSLSDSDIDIRMLLMGRSFVLCRCANNDCDCDGEVWFPQNSLEGEVTNLYLDPLDNNKYLKPTLKLAKAGWKKSETNVVRLKLGGITAPGVVSSTGELVLTASRVVEMVKVSSFYTKQGVRSPLKYKDIECCPYMLEKVEDEVIENQDSSRRLAESEDSGDYEN